MAFLTLTKSPAKINTRSLDYSFTRLFFNLFGLFSRTLSAQALTSLLETLSSLFKYRLIPAVNPKLLNETWNVLSSVLPTCLVELQRAVAEVWAGVLRRLKADGMECLVLLLAMTVILDDAAAWIIVLACKVFVVPSSVAVFNFVYLVCFANLAHMHTVYFLNPH